MNDFLEKHWKNLEYVVVMNVGGGATVDNQA